MNPCSDEEYYYKLDNMVLGSNQILRNLFKSRWKSETNEEWIDDNDHVQTFITGVGQNAYKKALSYQKTAMKTKCLIDWDVSLLAAILINFGDPKKYELENTAVLTIKKMRNDLAHHPTKKVDKEDNKKNVDAFKTSLLAIGVENEDIQLLIDRSGITSSLKALEYMKDLHSKADKLFEAKQVDEAIQCYSEAIKIPSLLPINLGTAHEKRAEGFLKILKDPIADKDKCEQALLDSSKSIELNDFSWMAFYLSAQCHRWKNDFSKAILHYERALAISPSQKDVRNDLNSCKILNGDYERYEHLSPYKMPMNLEERVKHLENETGIKMDPKEFIHLNQCTGVMVKGQDHVFRGHQYFCGWDAPIDFKEAARHYTKAAALKNPEGMYNLGKCYLHGHGVKQDVNEALRILTETAEMDPKIFGELTSLRFNAGVACAQHLLGLMYSEGLGVERSHTEAALWYKRSMENGIGNAANNLGNLYSNGKGVVKDKKMAELCWKQAIILKDHNAPVSLFSYYINEMEPEKALSMMKIGREMGSVELQKMSDDEIQKITDLIKENMLQELPQIQEFEKVHKLQIKGLTFRQRLNRKNRHLDMRSIRMQEALEIMVNKKSGDRKDNWGGKAHLPTFSDIYEIEDKAINGSETATDIIMTYNYLLQLIYSLDAECNTNCNKLEVVNTYYQCAILNSHLVVLPVKSKKKLKSIIASLFDELCEKKNEDEMKTRYCFVVMNLSGSALTEDSYDVELLKEGIRRYPNQVNYYNHLTDRLGLKRKYREGKKYAALGLEKFPDDIDLLYARAVHMRILKDDLEDCIVAFKKFLSLAPFDHSKVPEAFYQISSAYLDHLKSDDLLKPSDLVKQVEHYFNLGLEAEKSQLPCYLPYGESDIKRIVELVLTSTKPKPTNFVKSSNSIKVEEQQKNIFERKPYLKSPTRKILIIQHRENSKYLHEEARRLIKRGEKSGGTTVSPKFKQPPAKNMSNVKPITLADMNPTEDHIFENRILDLTIIDDPNPHYPSIHLIAEDENGDTTRLYIYNVEKNKENLAKFRTGCRLAIINPYMRIGALTINNGIRNDEPRCIVYLEKVENMCRFCGQENASHKCSKCKRPYCSRECQTLDWKELNHKIICSIEYDSEK